MARVEALECAAAAITTHWTSGAHRFDLDGARRLLATVLKMFDLVMSSYRTGRPVDVKQLTAWENAVDENRWRVFNDTVAFMMRTPTEVERGAQYLMVARYLERCGDNLCKMGEKVHYMVSGLRVMIR